MTEFSLWEWFVLVQHELFLFAGIFFLIGAVDEIAMDLCWIWLKLTGRLKPREFRSSNNERPLQGPVAVFVPAWQEERVIAAMLGHMLQAWPQSALRVFVGVYRNDLATLEQATKAAGADPRVRIVVHDADGPTTKADCLNCLYRSLVSDEEASGTKVRFVILHDAEDMIDPAGLVLLETSLEGAALAQLPVIAMPQAGSRWVGSHYSEEFAEAHGRAMPVRELLGTAIPLAGVGCAITRDHLDRLARDGEPFASQCLTEDYELGLGLARTGERGRFVRARDETGRLIATRAYFPSDLDQSIRQKTRWIHGIAFQGWDRLGWSWQPAEIWMRLRDRRGPFAALVLFLGYLLVVTGSTSVLAVWFDLVDPPPISPLLETVLWLNLAALFWRAIWRFGFTANLFGWREGVRSIARIPVSNFIAILAGRKAFTAYLRSLTGKPPAWDKTDHPIHPAAALYEERST
ncbi:glycosyl transferase family protein [Qipengyuania sp. JC766]|uniref:glycosyl transferase family protein n=1 Tax=Qipengyuania sp. JC766 TaxID=3232139 RepID=UPI00345AC657